MALHRESMTVELPLLLLLLLLQGDPVSYSSTA